MKAFGQNDIVADMFQEFANTTEGISYQHLPENVRLNELVLFSYSYYLILLF
jgi:hypothetical protein